MAKEIPLLIEESFDRLVRVIGYWPDRHNRSRLALRCCPGQKTIPHGHQARRTRQLVKIHSQVWETQAQLRSSRFVLAECGCWFGSSFQTDIKVRQTITTNRLLKGNCSGCAAQEYSKNTRCANDFTFHMGDCLTRLPR
jgi:hypothetical protein